MPSSPQPRLVDLLTALQRRVGRSLEEALGEVGVTLDQWRTLRTLAEGAGMTMGELSERLQTPAPTTTRLVDALVDRTLVYRRVSTLDRRRVEAALSQAGDCVLAAAEAVAEAHESRLRELLGDDTVDTLVLTLPAGEPVRN